MPETHTECVRLDMSDFVEKIESTCTEPFNFSEFKSMKILNFECLKFNLGNRKFEKWNLGSLELYGHWNVGNLKVWKL